MSETYFATKPSIELAADLGERFAEWGNAITSNRLKRKWIKSYMMYYGKHWKDGTDLDDSEILKIGDEGELSAITLNHYRNLIKHILVLTTNQKPAFDVRAINSDHESLQQAKLGNNILEAYLADKKLRRYVRNAAEQALVFGKGFLCIEWNPNIGEAVAPQEYQDKDGVIKERVIYDGDIDASNPSPFDVYVDQTQEDWNRCDWVLIRTYKNKYDLMVRYPELSAQIEAIPNKSELDGKKFVSLQRIDETEDVAVYKFYHKPTDSLPNGRYASFSNSDTVFHDGPNPYDSLPIFRITPGEVFGTTEGYTDAFDLMGPQQALNILMSTAFSNEASFGVQSVLVPEGANLSHVQLGKGMSALSYNPAVGKPESLQLTNTPAEIFDNMGLLERTMETLSGVNSVARGNPESSLKSGVALGLVQSMAVQFASAFQESYAELLEDAGTFILDLLKIYANTERIVTMAGRWSKGAIKSFDKTNLDKVGRCVVNLGNPMSRTTAGKIQIADNLLERGLIKNPQEYITVMTTGQLDPLMHSEESEIGLIHKENDDLSDGKQVTALRFDSHLMHMKEHKVLLADPFIRENGQYVDLILQHIAQHELQYQQQTPIMLMVTGEPPPPPPPMPMMMGPDGMPLPPPDMGGGPMPPPQDSMSIGPGTNPIADQFKAPGNDIGDKRAKAILPTQFGG